MDSFHYRYRSLEKKITETLAPSFAYLCPSIVLTGTICHQFQSCQFLKFFRAIEARDITNFCYETSYCCYSYPLFMEALQKKSHLEYLLDILVFGEIEEKALLVMEYGKEVALLEQRISEFICREAETGIGSSQ